MKNNSFLKKEIILLFLGILPSILTFFIILNNNEFSNSFIKTQVFGQSFFNIFSFGIPVAISSKSLKKNLYPSKINILLASLLFSILSIILFYLGEDFAKIVIIAHTFFNSVTFRITSNLYISRSILILQFLIFFQFNLGLLLINIIINLYILIYIYNKTDYVKLKNSKLLDAWFSSFVKDFFLRGHIWLLSFVGLNIDIYTKILRLLEIFSRPYDYFFQRLVDESKINLFKKYFSLVMIPPAIFLILDFFGNSFDFTSYWGYSVLFPLVIIIYILNKFYSFYLFSKFQHQRVYLNYMLSIFLFAFTLIFITNEMLLIIPIFILQLTSLLQFYYAKIHK